MGRSQLFLVYVRAACIAAACIAVLLAALSAQAHAAGAAPLGPVSGLPVPRFVSLKPDKVNVRAGPNRDHDVTWQYTRAGLPVETGKARKAGSTIRCCRAGGPPW
jgi:SH3-like domain-containing protein